MVTAGVCYALSLLISRRKKNGCHSCSDWESEYASGLSTHAPCNADEVDFYVKLNLNEIVDKFIHSGLANALYRVLYVNNLHTYDKDLSVDKVSGMIDAVLMIISEYRDVEKYIRNGLSTIKESELNDLKRSVRIDAV